MRRQPADPPAGRTGRSWRHAVEGQAGDVLGLESGNCNRLSGDPRVVLEHGSVGVVSPTVMSLKEWGDHATPETRCRAETSLTWPSSRTGGDAGLGTGPHGRPSLGGPARRGGLMTRSHWGTRKPMGARLAARSTCRWGHRPESASDAGHHRRRLQDRRQSRRRCSPGRSPQSIRPRPGDGHPGPPAPAATRAARPDASRHWRGRPRSRLPRSWGADGE